VHRSRNVPQTGKWVQLQVLYFRVQSKIKELVIYKQKCVKMGRNKWFKKWLSKGLIFYKRKKKSSKKDRIP
jgi:hypothetical protein